MYNVEEQVRDILKKWNIGKGGLTNELVKMAKELDLKEKGSVVWCAEDIIERAREQKKYYRVPRQKEAQQILEYMIHKHDASIGINWDVIDCYLPDKGTKPFENSNI